MEPARYKDYILTLLFVKYVSDRFKSSDNWDIEVPEGGSFDGIVALKYKKNIDDSTAEIVEKLKECAEGIHSLDMRMQEISEYIDSKR